MRFEMKMPDLATTESEIRVLRWMIEPGQQVQRGQPLLEVETDKATMEVESVVTGVLREVRAGVDTAVSVGDVIAVLEIAAAPQRSRAAGAAAARGNRHRRCPPRRRRPPLRVLPAACSPATGPPQRPPRRPARR